MARPVIHMERVVRRRAHTVTGTLCNRMVGDGDINSTDVPDDVTCKICARLMKEEAAFIVEHFGAGGEQR